MIYLKNISTTNKDYVILLSNIDFLPQIENECKVIVELIIRYMNNSEYKFDFYSKNFIVKNVSENKMNKEIIAEKYTLITYQHYKDKLDNLDRKYLTYR